MSGGIKVLLVKTEAKKFKNREKELIKRRYSQFSPSTTYHSPPAPLSQQKKILACILFKQLPSPTVLVRLPITSFSHNLPLLLSYRHTLNPFLQDSLSVAELHEEIYRRWSNEKDRITFNAYQLLSEIHLAFKSSFRQYSQ